MEEHQLALKDARIEELEAALRDCLHVIEKGMEVRMIDEWPILKDMLPKAKYKAQKALAKL